MHRESEFGLDHPSQGPRTQRWLLREARFDEGYNLGRELVRALGATPARQQACDTFLGEGGFGLVEGWTRHPIHCGGLGFGRALVGDLSQHLVLDLDEIVGVEEAADLELRGVDSLGMAIQGTLLFEALVFGVANGQREGSDKLNV